MVIFHSFLYVYQAGYPPFCWKNLCFGGSFPDVWSYVQLAGPLGPVMFGVWAAPTVHSSVQEVVASVVSWERFFSPFLGLWIINQRGCQTIWTWKIDILASETGLSTWNPASKRLFKGHLNSSDYFLKPDDWFCLVWKSDRYLENDARNGSVSKCWIPPTFSWKPSGYNFMAKNWWPSRYFDAMENKPQLEMLALKIITIDARGNPSQRSCHYPNSHGCFVILNHSQFIYYW